jgi:hypothetical protein
LTITTLKPLSSFWNDLPESGSLGAPITGSVSFSSSSLVRSVFLTKHPKNLA